MQAMQQHRPPIDCHAHEHDIRQALGRPGNRDHHIATSTGIGLIERWDGSVPLIVEFADGSIAGAVTDSEAVVLSDVTPFEIFRSASVAAAGRRSRPTTGPANPTGRDGDREWFGFGPAAHRSIE